MLLMGTIATHVINPLSADKSPYDPQKDFTPISLLAKVPNVLLVGKQVKAANLKELIALIKAQPGKFAYGSSGIGTPPHLSGELFKSMAGLDIAHVPYKGGGPAMSDLIGGQIPLLFDVLSGAASHIRAGTARPIAVTLAQRVPSFRPWLRQACPAMRPTRGTASSVLPACRAVSSTCSVKNWLPSSRRPRSRPS
jgi:tripartite-type tricarboxylate transporter receptor subunit TctC